VVSTQHSENNQGRRYVIVTDGGYAGRAGYVKEYLILTDLPDAQAVEYYIATPNLKLQWLVQNHKHFEDYDITTGDDARTLAMAVYMANHERGRGGVYLNQEKLREAKDPGFWEGAKDEFDEYRRVLRPFFQAVELKLGEKIWLPGPAYVARLKDLNIVPTRQAWKNAAIMFGKAAAGSSRVWSRDFVGSIVDLVVGIWDLIKTVFTTVRDLFTGEPFRKGREIYDAVTKYLDSKTPGGVLSDLLNALGTAAGEMWTNFLRRWTASNLFDKWNFHGRVIGYLAAEILMARPSWSGDLRDLHARVAPLDRPAPHHQDRRARGWQKSTAGDSRGVPATTAQSAVQRPAHRPGGRGRPAGVESRPQRETPVQEPVRRARGCDGGPWAPSSSRAQHPPHLGRRCARCRACSQDP
jgi:hypothetical protein